MIRIDGTCKEAESTDCLPLNITSSVAYYGDEPVDLSSTIRRALLFWSFDDIPGWRGFSNVGYTLTEDGGSSGGDGSDGRDGNGTSTDGGDRGISSVQGGNQNTSNNDTNPGAFVAAGVAALILIVLAIFIIQRRNKKNLEQVNESMKHIQMTDDEEDEHLVAHERSMEKTHLSYINDDNDIVSVVDNSIYHDHKGGSDGEGTEVMASHAAPSRENSTFTQQYRQQQLQQQQFLQEERDPPSVMMMNASHDASSLDESSYYRYPSRHIITHRIDSYNNEVNENNNSRQYRITDDTVTL